MKATKKQLAVIDAPYAIQLISWKGRDYCIAASEERNGEIVLIDLESKRVQKVIGLKGGIMNIIPDEDGSMFAIERFYPVFQSEKARIMRFTLNESDGDEIIADVELVADLPYVHRILTLDTPEGKKIVAGTLCETKAFEQDWSSPGSVYIMPARAGALPERLPELIHKNHGMWRYNKNESILISGVEGVYELSLQEGRPKLSRIMEREVSDICMFDLDGDGQDELITIEKFHGDEINVYSSKGDSWELLAHADVKFCHAIWAGIISGEPCILACNRGGDMETVMYKVHSSKGGEMQLSPEVIDSGTGGANLAVLQKDGAVLLMTANRNCGEIAAYALKI